MGHNEEVIDLMTENANLKAALKELLEGGDVYTDGLACVWCNPVEDEDADQLIHDPDCPGEKARVLLEKA